MLFADVASCYWLFRGYGLCRLGCRRNFANLCFLFKPPPLPFFLFEASARLKLVSVPLTFAVYISFLVTLRKVSRRALYKALRWDKVDTIRRVCIVQYSTYSRFIWLNGSITGLKQKGTIMLAFLGWPLSLWPRKQSCRGQIYWARAQSQVDFGLGQDFFSRCESRVYAGLPTVWLYIWELDSLWTGLWSSGDPFREPVYRL